MHVSGVAVRCRPDDGAAVMARLEDLEGVEVAHLQLSEGKMAVVIESADLSGQLAQFRTIRALEGVLSAEVAYHAFEGDPTMRPAPTADAAPQILTEE